MAGMSQIGLIAIATYHPFNPDRAVAFRDNGFFFSDLECPRGLAPFFSRFLKPPSNHSNQCFPCAGFLARPSLFI